MKLMWTGSDVLYLKSFPPFVRLRFKFKIMLFRLWVFLGNPFVQEHYAVSERLRQELNEAGFKRWKVKVLQDPCKYGALPREPHKGFNVLYYIPAGKKNKKFIDWLYGRDIYEEVKRLLPDVNFFEVNGNVDLAEIYPYIDFYLRPTRHDGAPRMVAECELSGIPYYYSVSEPKVDDIVREIKKYLKKNEKKV